MGPPAGGPVVCRADLYNARGPSGHPIRLRRSASTTVTVRVERAPPAGIDSEPGSAATPGSECELAIKRLYTTSIRSRLTFPSGLRGRLVVALAATATATLLVAAAVLLPPLQERLRSNAIE